MSGFEQVLWYIAVPASVVFAIQALLMLMGTTFDHGEGGMHDNPGTGDAAGGYSPVFTLRNLVIFLMMFGWTGIAMLRQFNTGVTLAVIVALVAGLAMMFLVASMFYGVSRLASSGNVVVNQDIVGREATVYLKIPAASAGSGKVTVVFQGVQRELAAITEGPEIPTGTLVKISSLKENGSVVVAAAK